MSNLSPRNLTRSAPPEWLTADEKIRIYGLRVDHKRNSSTAFKNARGCSIFDKCTADRTTSFAPGTVAAMSSLWLGSVTVSSQHGPKFGDRWPICFQPSRREPIAKKHLGGFYHVLVLEHRRDPAFPLLGWT